MTEDIKCCNKWCEEQDKNKIKRREIRVMTLKDLSKPYDKPEDLMEVSWKVYICDKHFEEYNKAYEKIWKQ